VIALTSNLPSRTESDDYPWDDLVISILAVNQYSLERTYNSLEGLQQAGITDPLTLARSDAPQIEAKLRAAGCDRGSFMTRLFSERLAALGVLIRTTGVSECEKVITGRNAKEIENLLQPVKGIGPVVLRNFYVLRQIPH